MTRRVYLDTCLLILAFGGKQGDPLVALAWQEINQADTTFLYSRILELETLPEPTRSKRDIELEYFRDYYASAEFIECTAQAADIAFADAMRTCMTAADALHVGCAVVGNADEIVTAEGKKQTLPKATAIPVRTIRA